MNETLTLEQQAIQALKGIYDPELPVNIYDLGLIYQLHVNEEEKKIEVKMTLTTPMCPVAQTFPQTVQDHLLKLPEVSEVKVELVWEPPWSKDNLSEEAKLQLNLL